MISRKAISSDIPGILALQSLNLITELNEEQKQSNGFVTTPFNQIQLEEIISKGWAFVTEINEQIVAYLFGGPWTYYEQWPIFSYMTDRFHLWREKGWDITTENSFQYGPVCIDAHHRGKKIINHLFETMRSDFRSLYPTAGTFINQANQISTKAHIKLGWVIVDKFSYGDNSYHGLVYDMNKELP